MKIEVVNIKQAISKGLSVEAYVFLTIINDGCLHLFKENTFASISKDLEMSGLCINNEITEKGRKLLEEIEGNNVVSSKVDIYASLHTKLQNKLVELTGKKQKVIQNKYSFLPNLRDFTQRLSKIIKKYKLSDWNKLEILLLQHIEKSHKANFEYVQLLDYYIEKNNSSKLATDYEDFVENGIKEVNSFDGVNI
jgi:hypothetical protein